MADFEPSETFTGNKEGYFFGTGPKGVGYYRDLGSEENALAAIAEAATTATATATADDVDEKQEQEELHLDPLEDDDDPDARGKTYQAESLCMNCQENGTSTFYVTQIPHFRDIIISSFRCEHCGYGDTLVQPNSEIPTHGVKYKLQVTTPADLNRQVVKSAYCTITIPELGLSIPKESQAGSLSTVEGILQKTTVALHESNEARQQVDPEGAAKVAEFVKELALTTAGSVGPDGVLLERPFTFVVEDPSGDSYVETTVLPPAVDPQLQRETYVRSEIENKLIGLFTDAQLGIDRSKPFQAPQGGTLTDDRIMEMYQRAEDLDLVRFECVCPACQSTGENRMCTVTVPHFQVCPSFTFCFFLWFFLFLFLFSCAFCCGEDSH